MMAESPPSRPPPDLETLQFNAWDAEFSADMSHKMRVPDSIRVAGDSKHIEPRDSSLAEENLLLLESRDRFNGHPPLSPSSSMTNGLASTPPQQQQQREDGFGVWGGPVGPEHSVDAYGLMHPHDALEITRDRTRRSMTVPQRILVAGDEGNEIFGTTVSRQSSSASSAPSRHQMELDLSSAAPAHRGGGFGGSGGGGGDSGIQLSTPPEVLTIESKFPTVYHEETPQGERAPRTSGLPGGDPRSASPLLRRKTGRPGSAAADAIAGIGSLQGSINDVSVAHLNMTPLDDVGAITSVQEETVLLRRHVAKLSRRVNQLEQDNLRRSYREYLVYPVALGYFIVKLLSWFRRSH